ncbi:MAG: BMC domain-containing protein [Romboutsia sp.]|uniref:BMC domain-containing protein n=1 Tax=Romboutsia sp. TaxID=1965302 RepID=UPI003F3A2F52
MKKAIGLVELKSIPVGIEVADAMLTTANVELILANPICPGKYVIVVSGNVGSVESAVAAGKQTAGIFLIESHILNNIHEDILPALSGTNEIGKIKSIGAIETISALTAIKAGDIALKASNVDLIELRVARGLGGKGFLIISGEVSSVKSAIKSCLNELGESGDVTSTSVVASPHKDLISKLV